ncbi:hypothetical protein JANAI62_18410 [Jannaschia pagri]|uniref:Methanogenic corrinoid protein MtbC1 n=2 Tax=Jannaschia TaxID=188905 RepID=A0ABQ4NLC7_9RHOB|nr:hypothetical protein [Jannaschia sp. AI_62]GIT91384.1 hypothetical protein JANAI61_18420 [Jannaschia sp. AI_61]GIT95218.1 hypothetical protein JANAI62_18410 [Jannaschia sp. AI_62]
MIDVDDGPRRAILDLAGRRSDIARVLLDRVFPDVARLLDSGWQDDRLSFVDVTIAATRLQDAIRTLSRQSPAPRGAQSLTMIVPRWEQHGLPAAFAADQLRALGAPTSVLAGLSGPDLVRITSRAAPAGILISVASYRSVAQLPELIRTLRQEISKPIPIVVGGPAMALNAQECRRSGADLATNDIRQAAKFCDIQLSDGHLPARCPMGAGSDR